MTPLTLPILFNIEVIKQYQQFKDLGIDVNEDTDDMEVRYVIFYEITAISPHKEAGNEDKTIIYAGGDEFICTMPIEKVKYLIDNKK
jgi:hypothetical protein